MEQSKAMLIWIKLKEVFSRKTLIKHYFELFFINYNYDKFLDK